MEILEMMQARLAKKLVENLETEMDNIFEKFKDKLYLTNGDVAPILILTQDNLRQRIDKGYYAELIEPKIKEKEHTRWHKYKFLQKYFGGKISELSNIA